MAANTTDRETGCRVVFLGCHKQPSYIVDTFNVPSVQDLQTGEVLVKILLATICSTDLLSIEGKSDENTPCVLGHEGVAEVLYCKKDSSDGVSNLRPGDRIVFCGHCVICSQLSCQHHLQYGHTPFNSRSNLNGTFSTHLILRQSTQIVQIPRNLPDRYVAPVTCALATLMKATRPLISLDKTSQRSVAVIQGAGLFGMYACAILNELGYKQIYCQDIKEKRLKLVTAFGGIPVLVNKNHDIRIRAWPPEESADVVIEVCADNEAFSKGLNLLKHGGIYLLIGLVKQQSKLYFPADIFIKKCLTIKGCYNYSVSDLKEAVDFLQNTKDKYPYDELLSPSYSIQDFHNAISTAKLGRFHRVALSPASSVIDN